jgi:hypothetical protein
MAGASPLLDEEHAAFLQGGVSMLAASRDPANAPKLARALGCRVAPDRRRVTVFLAAYQAAEVLAAIRTTGTIAVGFNLPSTHRSLQLKGTDAVVSALEPGDLEIAARYVAAFVADIRLLGYEERLGRALLAFEPAELVAVGFTPSLAFVQTPGPRAGARLERQSP